jgi:hypothetical protein
MYLQCVDRTEYAGVLKGAGLYTVFAPNDEAFAAYLKDKSYASVAAIPDEEVKKIVSYSIVYSKWTMEHLADVFEEGEYVTGAFKRKTTCYALPYQDSDFNDKWVVDETVRGNLSWNTTNYQVNLTMQNYKYLPVYTSAYFNSFPLPLTAADYNTFYPHSTYTGKNVQEGTILTENIVAENGIIHEVSTVNEPMQNMELLLQKPDYAAYKALLDYKSTTENYAFKTYEELPSALLETFKKMMPHANIDKLYLKYYNRTYTAFSPLMENIYSDATGTYDTEKTGNTLFIPQNEVLNEFIREKLLKHYESMDKLPLEVISTLINTHMVTSLVWPSSYTGTTVATGEYVNGAGSYGNKFDADGIVSKKLTSNGFVYQIDHIIKSRFFETVYSDIYLNPLHTMLNQAYVNFYSIGLREDLMKSNLNGYPSERYTLLNFSDDLLKADGYKYNSISNAFENSEMPSTAGVSDDRLKRLMRMHVFPGLKNNEINSEVTGFSEPVITNYNGWGFLVNYAGDMIRYKDNRLQAAGNIEAGTYATVTPVADDFNNGLVFNVDNMLQYSPRETKAGDDRWKETTLWQYLAKAKREHPNVSMFVDYVERCLKNPDTDEMDGIKAENYYTVLMVNNTAMNQALSRGYIKPLATLGDDLNDLAQATQFISAHFLQGTVLADDGLTYLYPVNPMSPNRILLPTILKITDEALGLTNERTYIEITKTAAGLMDFMPQNVTLGSRILVRGAFGTTSTLRVQRGLVTGSTLTDNFRSNRIASKAVLHEINNFFIFTVATP